MTDIKLEFNFEDHVTSPSSSSTWQMKTDKEKKNVSQQQREKKQSGNKQL